ncbi:6-phosphogluconolactonase isoform X2 [Cuculus canorus]|uniref:6-phosphogluconolactonase isoform X2 n=1 Tax=Cuculus canorus TaxID=55661 RepID=UPI0023AB20B8|nr:6-phosphogluconolactonase isoform X2 [Cuculus canorus]
MAAAVSVFASPAELGEALAGLVAARAAARGGAGRFSLGLSGGSLVELLAKHLPPALRRPERPAEPWLLALCDERVAPGPNPHSTARHYRERLLPQLPAPAPTVLVPNAELGPDGAARDYGERLRQETEEIVAALTDSPKPPPERVTLTLPVLNAARTVVFAVTGEEKAPVVKRILEGNEENPLPAARVRPHSGELLWFLDEAAAKELTIPVEKHSGL